MDTRLRLGLIGIATLVLASCSYPSESEVMERLAATETAAAEVIEIALGAEGIGPWERDEAVGLLGEEVVSRMLLPGTYQEEVLQGFEEAARAVGGHASPVYRVTTEVTQDGEVTQEIFDGAYRVVSLGSGLYDVKMDWDSDTGQLQALISTGPFEPSR